MKQSIKVAFDGPFWDIVVAHVRDPAHLTRIHLFNPIDESIWLAVRGSIREYIESEIDIHENN